MHKNHNLQAVWFAAGMAVIIACLERAVVVSIFKQLHMWVFLALNLLLIAILFTSKYPLQDLKNPSQKCDSSQDSCKKPPSPGPEVVEDHRDAVVEDGVKGNEDMAFEEEDEGDDEKTTTLLTNDELNERVEAFISRFRQEYLVSDVKVISRSRSDNVCVGTNHGVFEKTITV
nr:oligopeptide transport ATP-binding protein like [Tanacetum cinerariifolium]GEZ28865.1 oligopeptide transport ATP-binding protein like [Tanacetum cinerariifolium]